MTRYTPGTALVVVDVQNDFADPGGSLFVNGGDQIVGRVNTEIAAARAGGAVVVFTQDWHPEATPHFAEQGGVWPVHCVHGTWGADLHPGLDVAAGQPIVRKGTGAADGYSGFTVRDLESATDEPTELDPLLRAHGVTKVVVVGIATDVCVKATVLDALALGYEAEVLAGATAAVELAPGDAERALDEMRGAGAMISE